MKLSEQQWIQFGEVVKKLHTANIPPNIKNDLPKETFLTKWCDRVNSFLDHSQNGVFDDNISSQTALFLKSKRRLISSLIERVKQLRRTLQSESFDYVICHADIHGWNLLIDEKNILYLIDWDTLILAPKERDLMFIGSGIWESGYTPVQEKKLFYKGYGETEVNRDVIKYYRLERIIEDIGIYCEHIFFSKEDLQERMQSFECIQTNFLPNGTIERACEKDI